MNHARHFDLPKKPTMWCGICKMMHSDYTVERILNDEAIVSCNHHPFSRMTPGPHVQLASNESASVPERLRAAANTYEERNKLYGDNYKNFGKVMEAMFPNGLVLAGANDWNRFGIFVQMVSKMTRYAINLSKGGHKDSAHDLAVYSAMLEELTYQTTQENENE